MPLEWLAHYFGGTQTTKTLPKEYVDEAKYFVRNALSLHIRRAYYFPRPFKQSLVANLQGTAEGHWFTTGAGVVGAFNFYITTWSSEVIKVRCVDTFDFNTMPYGIPLDPRLNTPTIRKLLNTFASKWNIKVYEEDGLLKVDEASLSALNKEHAFKTEWEHSFTWEDILGDFVQDPDITSNEIMEKVEPKWGGAYICKK